MISINELNTMKNASFQDYGIDDLIDLREVRIDKERPRCQRITDFIHATRNPYIFKVGDVIVKIQCNPDGKSFSDALANCFAEE